MYTLTRDQKKKGLEVQKPFLKRFLVAEGSVPRMGPCSLFRPALAPSGPANVSGFAKQKRRDATGVRKFATQVEVECNET